MRDIFQDLRGSIDPHIHPAPHSFVRLLDDVEIAAAIRELGASRCLLSSDLGQLHDAPPAEGLRDFIQALREEGIGDRELAVMTREVPARLLGLA